MRLTTKGTYALEAVLAMALQPPESKTSVRAAGEMTGLPDTYLEQIFSLLRKSGIIKGARGSRGGYCLARTPDLISVGDVLRAGEGSLAPVRCTEAGAIPCGRLDACLTRPVWSSLDEAITGFVDRLTLADLAAAFQAGGYAGGPAEGGGNPA